MNLWWHISENHSQFKTICRVKSKANVNTFVDNELENLKRTILSNRRTESTLHLTLASLNIRLRIMTFWLQWHFKSRTELRSMNPKICIMMFSDLIHLLWHCYEMCLVIVIIFINILRWDFKITYSIPFTNTRWVFQSKFVLKIWNHDHDNKTQIIQCMGFRNR